MWRGAQCRSAFSLFPLFASIALTGCASFVTSIEVRSLEEVPIGREVELSVSIARSVAKKYQLEERPNLMFDERGGTREAQIVAEFRQDGPAVGPFHSLKGSSTTLYLRVFRSPDEIAFVVMDYVTDVRPNTFPRFAMT